MKLKVLGVLGVLLSLWSGALAASATSVGTVICGGGRGGNERRAAILFAAVQPNAEGADLLIVEEQGVHVLTLNRQLVVQGASTIEGQELGRWNLVAYDRSPVKLSSTGAFSIGMMVSTRSACQFQGQATFLKEAQTQLFGSDKPVAPASRK